MHGFNSDNQASMATKPRAEGFCLNLVKGGLEWSTFIHRAMSHFLETLVATAACLKCGSKVSSFQALQYGTKDC